MRNDYLTRTFRLISKSQIDLAKNAIDNAPIDLEHPLELKIGRAHV